MVFLFILLSLVAGFSYRIGYDVGNYMYYFDNVYPLNKFFQNEFNGEFLWVLLVSTCKTIYDDFFFLHIIQSLFVNGVLFWFIYKYSSKPFLSVFVYYLTLWPLLNFEAIREAIAVAFFLLSVDVLLEGKRVIFYYIRFIPAIFFHTFAIVGLFFPLLFLIKPSKRSLIIFVVVGLALFVISPYLNNILLSYAIYFDKAFEEKTVMYLTSMEYGTSIWSINGILSIIIGQLLPVLYLCYLLILLPDNVVVKKFFPFVLALFGVTVLKLQTPIFFRYYNYFYIFLIVGMTSCFSEEHSLGHSRLIKLRITGLIFIFFVFFTLAHSNAPGEPPAYNRYYPYNSIFTKDYNVKTEMLLPR